MVGKKSVRVRYCSRLASVLQGVGVGVVVGVGVGVGEGVGVRVVPPLVEKSRRKKLGLLDWSCSWSERLVKTVPLDGQAGALARP